MFFATGRKFLIVACHKLPSCFLNKRVINKIRVISQRDHFYQYDHKYKNKATSPGSRYVPPSRQEQAEESVVSALRGKHFMNEEEWDDFKLKLIGSLECVSEETFSVIVMNVLVSSNQLDLSHSFIDYLERSNVKPNFLTYLKYISLCSKNHRKLGQDKILRLLDKVTAEVDKSPILDSKRIGYFIQGLCVTDRWKESLKYLSKLYGSKPSREICNSLACAAIRNGDEGLAWEILIKWMNSYEAVSDEAIEEFLLVALKIQKSSFFKSELLIMKLFDYMQSRNIIVNVEVAKLIEQYFKSDRSKWKITYTKVTRKGVCVTCQHCLKPSNLESEEFGILRNSFLERAVKKSDLFINTTCEEFAKYMRFIDRNKPFDIVLDGLNAAYSFPGLNTKKKLSSNLLNIVQMLSKESQKLLIVGRKHMQFWPKYEMMKISQKAKMFFTDNISQDDPFVIYAALASGPHTLFLSDDLMRDHLSRLGDSKLIHLFKKWQLSHQIIVQYDENKEVQLVEPVKHNIAVQGDMKHSWHVPFDDKIILDPYEELNNWLCIERVK